jgi:hypothetical protein
VESRASKTGRSISRRSFDARDQVVTIVRQRGKAKHGGPEVEIAS